MNTPDENLDSQAAERTSEVPANKPAPIKFDRPKRAVFNVEFDDDVAVREKPASATETVSHEVEIPPTSSMPASVQEILPKQVVVVQSSEVAPASKLAHAYKVNQASDVVQAATVVRSDVGQTAANPSESSKNLVRPVLKVEVPKDETQFHYLYESVPGLGILWDLLSIFIPAIIVLIISLPSIRMQFEQPRKLIPLLCVGAGLVCALVVGKRSGLLPRWRKFLAIGISVVGLVMVGLALIYWSSSLAIVAIAISFIAWGAIRFAGEPITRLIAVVLLFASPWVFDWPSWQSIESTVGHAALWFASGFMDIFGISHTASQAGISFGLSSIDPKPYLDRWNGVTSLVAISLFLSILWRRSLVVTVLSAVFALFWWAAVMSIGWARIGWQVSAGSQDVSLPSSPIFYQLFLVALIGLIASEILFGEVFASIPLGKFDTDFPLVTALWNRLASWPAAVGIMRDVELDNAGMMDDDSNHMTTKGKLLAVEGIPIPNNGVPSDKTAEVN